MIEGIIRYSLCIVNSLDYKTDNNLEITEKNLLLVSLISTTLMLPILNATPVFGIIILNPYVSPR